MGPRRGQSEPSLPQTQLTSGPWDGCTYFLKVKLWALPVEWTPWAGPHLLAPLADPVSARQKQESVPFPARGRKRKPLGLLSPQSVEPRVSIWEN